ncbi:MAG: hypothetical protein JWO03_2567 [Bacteroidetes bacterium]|nr:hypothetical protein [Bacteroidota bacterium]
MEGISTRCRRSVLLVFLLVNAICLFGQNAMLVTVYDSTTMQVLSDAIVRVMPLAKNSKIRGEVDASDRRGQVSITFSEPLVLHISYLGYNAIFDTVYSAQSKNYYIKRTASNIEDVVVTGQYNPGSAKASVYDVKVYTEKDFRDKGATNLREALQGSLNIDMAQDAIFGSGISLQGISGEGVKIMVDGVPIVGRIDGKLDVSQINLSNIERVEIVKGPMSAVYGSDAMGGVINLISKTNQNEKYAVNLKGYYESVGQYNVELNGGIHLGKSQLYVAAGRNFFDGFSVVDTARHKDWLPKEQYFANAKYVYSTGKFKVGASLSFFRELLLDRGNLLPNTTYAFDNHSLSYRPQATLFASVPIKDYSQLDLMIAYTGFVRFFNYYKKDLVTLQESLRHDQLQDTSFYHDIVGRGTYTLTARNKKISFQFGADVTQEYTNQTLLSGRKHQMGDYAVFGSVRWKPLPSLDIQPAVRFGYNTLFSSPLIPSINLKYDFARYFNVRAAYGMGYRAPSLYELYFDFHDQSHNLNGDSALQAEKGHSVNLSLGYQQLIRHNHRVKVTATGFFNKINNKIDYILTDATTSPVTYRYGNINQYMTAGGECVVEYAWQRFSASVGFDYIWYYAQVEQPIRSTTTFASPDVTVQVGYKIPKAEIGINVFYKYTGPKLNYSLSNTVETGTRGAFNALDLSLSRNFWKDRIQLTCGAKNLLNITNVGNNGVMAFGHGSSAGNTLVGWGRSYFISLNLHFAK